jgi:hypothetical protein
MADTAVCPHPPESPAGREAITGVHADVAAKDRMYLLRALRTFETQSMLADRFGISQQTVSRYITRAWGSTSW